MSFMWACSIQVRLKTTTTTTQLLLNQLNKNLKFIPKNFRDKFLHVNSIGKKQQQQTMSKETSSFSLYVASALETKYKVGG